MINIFQSTHPSWGATVSNAPFPVDFKFQSTHPSWGATWNSAPKFFNHFNFNPRTHRGVRHLLKGCRPEGSEFQSTHPSWGATFDFQIPFSSSTNFNPRTHRGVRRITCLHSTILIHNFNPRTHRGVRQPERVPDDVKNYISIHAPIVGCDFNT